jgi:Synaptobrevin
VRARAADGGCLFPPRALAVVWPFAAGQRHGVVQRWHRLQLSRCNAQVSEVKNIMVDNIEKVLERGEKIELLVDKTDNLRFQASANATSG